MNLAALNSSSWYKQLRRPSRGATDLVFTGIVRGASAPLAFVSYILIAHLLGPKAFGSYITLFSASIVMGGIAEFGVGLVLTREIAATIGEKRRTLIIAMSRWAFGLTGLLSLVTMILLLVWLVFVPSVPSYGWFERFVTLAIVPNFVWVCLVSGVLGGMSLVAKSQSVGNVLKNSLLLVGIGAMLLAGAHQAADVILVQAISYMLSAMVGIYWVLRAFKTENYRKINIGTAFEASETKVLHRSWRRSAKHFFAMHAAVLILGRVDVVVVNTLAGSTQAGYFGAAARLAQIAPIVGLVWIAWLQPRVSDLFQSGQLKRLRKIFTLGFYGAVSMTAVSIAIAWILAPRIMALMGAGFDGAINPFRWLLIGYLASAACVPSYVMLAMTGLESTLSKILWGQLVVTLALSFPLVHFYGALGGAWAWAGGLVVGSVWIIGAGYFYRARNYHIV